MATNTYVALDKQTLVSAASSVTFSAIPSTYTDLRIVYASTASADATNYIRFNSDSASNYSNTALYGDGSSPGSNRNTSATGIFGPFTMSGNQTFNTIDVFNYANTTTFKSVLIKAGAANNSVLAGVGMWRKTPETISSISIFCSGANFSAGSSFALYGIAAVGATPVPKATGGTVYSDSTYYYHVFGSTGVFTPTQSISADILCVAGGGGGTSAFGGGGGAGGLLAFTGQSLTATNYTVTVGAGGAGGANNTNATPGSTGGDSQFGALTLVKGGGGAQAYEADTAGSAANGGSGAGATYRESSKTNRNPFGTATSGQGNNGGNNNFASFAYSSGGGGGAGAGGDNNSVNATQAGNGGDGSSTYSSWGLATGTGQNVNGTYYYAGGGAGGADSSSPSKTRGGYGGGGNSVSGSSSSVLAIAGTANTGGGGGGGSYGGGSGAGGASGGSGIVIVRYAKA